VSRIGRPVAFLVVGVLVLTSAMLVAFDLQRRAAVRSAAGTDTTVLALTAMLDQESGLRGFLYTGQEDYLEPYIGGRSAYRQGRLAVKAAAAGDPTSVRLSLVEDAAARNWGTYASAAIAARRESISPRPYEAEQSEYGKQQMDRFRSSNLALRSRLAERRDATLRTLAILSTAGVVTVAGLFTLLGFALLHRRTRESLARSEAEVAYRNRQEEFAGLIQAVESEDEAHELVQRYIRRSLPGSSVTVLARNNSDNRLASTTPLPADSELGRQLVSAEPRSCLAIRLGRAHEGGPTGEELISCVLCRHISGTATCQPLLVGGKVIGTVLVEHSGLVDDAGRRLVSDTVMQAAPVLATLKTIAIAENRASTDALTALPNRRSMNDTLKRLVAQASRTGKPLAAIAFDLDHFKGINDRYGHETGDAALSAVGEVLRECLRESDFAARVGGEEFLVLAPDTDAEGARVLAEKLREAILREDIPQLLEPLAASFGVASIPSHGSSGETLLRHADRASYLAKERGRNRVEIATVDDHTPPGPHLVADLPRDQRRSPDRVGES
jgi:diguanylate cyclase (GGDEF)-like protein